MQIDNRLDLYIRSARRVGDGHADRTIFTVFTKQIVVTVIPSDVEPHTATFRITGNQLMSGQVDHFQSVAIDLQVAGLLQVFDCTLLTQVHRQDLVATQAAAEA